MRELWALAFGSPAGVCGPCVGISGRLEIAEVTVRLGGFVGPRALVVGCTLAVWFEGAGLDFQQQWAAPWRICF